MQKKKQSFMIFWGKKVVITAPCHRKYVVAIYIILYMSYRGRRQNFTVQDNDPINSLRSPLNPQNDRCALKSTKKEVFSMFLRTIELSNANIIGIISLKSSLILCFLHFYYLSKIIKTRMTTTFISNEAFEKKPRNLKNER